MFRKELLLIGSYCLVIFLLVGLSTLLVIRQVQKNASMVALDNLPGLVDAGGALSRMDENWLSTVELAKISNPAEQTSRINQILANSNEDLWEEYGKSIFEQEDHDDFEQLVSARTTFLHDRDLFFSLIKTEPLPQATSFLDSKLRPDFAGYQAAAKALFAYNVRIGRERAANILWYSQAAPLLLAFFSVLLFGLGMMMGLRGAFTGLDIIFRRRLPHARK